ncbi:MAG: tetratricopeptide repeat protein [Candidatus Melainabacteria bacterium]|nr:MAG: tetratricopeptide repeat protein [Candidatus Melainabacteria bacterium]
MSVDDSAISGQQEPVPGADSGINKHKLPDQNGNNTAAGDLQAPIDHPETAAHKTETEAVVLTSPAQPGVTDAEWHNASLPVPAPKSQDELMEHLSEALADMASDFTELPALEVPKDLVINRPGSGQSAPTTAQAAAPSTPQIEPNQVQASDSVRQTQTPPATSSPGNSPAQPALPPQPEHRGPSQQIRSSLPPGSLSSQSNPQLTLPQSAGQTAPAEQNRQDSSPSHWGPPPQVQAQVQNKPTSVPQSRPETPASSSESTIDTGDHPTVDQQQSSAQQFFVLEGVAPPATPEPRHERKIETPAQQQSEQSEQRDGLQIRRLIATQQGMAAAQRPDQPIQQDQPESQQNQIDQPQQNQVNPPQQMQAKPVAPSRPSPNDPPKSVGTTSQNAVQLPPMFGGKSNAPQKDTQPASGQDQQRAHTDLHALPKPPGSKTGEPRPTTGPVRIPAESEAPKNGIDPDGPTRPVLTGHNFQPRQADPRSSMSALKAMPAPVPSSPAPGQPVSPLGAALASSLPASPPTGQHMVPAALREPPHAQATSDQVKTETVAAPQSTNAERQDQSKQSAAPQNSSQSAQPMNPLGPAASRPLPTLDNSGTVNQGGHPSKQIPGQFPASTGNPLGPSGAPFPSVASPPVSASENPLGPASAPFAVPPSAQMQPGLPAPNVGANPLGAPPKPLSGTPQPPNVNASADAIQGQQSSSRIKIIAPTDSDDDLDAYGTTHYQSAPQENVTEQLYQKPSGIQANFSPMQELAGTKPPVQPNPPPPSLPSAHKFTDLVPGAPGHHAPGLPKPSGKPGSNQSQSGTTYPTRPQSPSPVSAAQTPIPDQRVTKPQSANPQPDKESTPPNRPPQSTGGTPAGVNPQQPGSPQQTESANTFQPQSASSSHPTQDGNSSELPPAAPVNSSPAQAPAATPPNPQLFPVKQKSRPAYNDLREETGMVLPHSAPEPDPNQRLMEDSGKAAIPGVTPASKPFETAQGRERREAKEREAEARNRVQLPATREEPEQEAEHEEVAAQKNKQPDRTPPVPKEPPKPRRQQDSGRSERFANLLHDAPNNQASSPAGGKRLRASQRGGAFSDIADLIKNRGRVAILALLAVPLVLSVSAVIFITGKSLIKVSMSPSQRAGEEAFNEGNYDRAVNYFNEAIKADDKRADLYHDRARANLHLQKYAAAVADYTSALNLDKNFASARLDRAAAYYYLGDYSKAIADYDELIKADANNVDAYFGRGLSYSKLKDYTPALADLNKVIELNPHHTGAFEDIANAYLAQGKLSEAIDAYSQSLKNNPRDANAFYMRANSYKRLGKTNEALNDFTSAIGIAPGRYEFYNDRGYALYESGKYKDAIADLAQALKLNPTYEIAKHNLHAACSKLIASIGNSAKSPEQLGDLAFAYYHDDKFGEAMAAANKALLLNAQFRPALNIRAAIELKDRRFDYALTDADNALKVKTDDKDAMLTRARAYLNLGRYDKAIKDYDSCVSENDNTSLFALRERALAHLLANEGALASKDAQQFLELNGWNNSMSGPTVLLWWLAKRQLQDLDGANAALSQGETRLKATQWPYGVLKFLKREMTLTELNNMARNEREHTDVRTWLGFDHLLGGLRDEARTDFEWVKKNGFRGNDDYLLAVEQLKDEARN